MKRFGIVLILLLAFGGIANSAYLVQHETDGTPLICNVQSLSGCNEVVSSAYSHIGSVSLAQLGLLFYTIMFVIAAFELILFNQLLRRSLQLFAVLGILSSLYSVYTQVYIIQALCIYCMVSAVLTLLILTLASFIEPVWKGKVPRAINNLTS